MAKTKLYFKNGKAYFKSGGRFYELPKAQIGDLAGQELSSQDNLTTINSLPPVESTSLQLSNPNVYQPNIAAYQMQANDMAKQTSQKATNNANYKKNLLSGLNTISAVSSFIPGQQSNDSAFVQSKMYDPNKGQTASIIKDTVSGLASADPTGTAQLANTLLQTSSELGKNIGAGVGSLIGGEAGQKTSKVIGNIFSPFDRAGEVFETLKSKGAGAAFKNFYTFGASGVDEENAQKKYISNYEQEQKARNAGTNVGSYRNDGIYSAKKGKNILTEPSKNIKKPNVEIEHDEIYLGNPGNVTKYDDATTSLTSKYATKFHGDWHGEDTDKDGMEGIPLNAPDGYIASNFLGLDGRPVKGQKDSKKTGKTVADEMTPLIKFLHDAEQNPKDLYKNNPAAIKQVLKQLEKMKNTAEKNKFREELIKMLRDKQGFDFESILAFIQENAPMEDMNPEEQQALQQIIGGGQEQQMPQQGEQQLSPEMIQQMMAAQGQQTPQAKYGKSMNNYYKRYQQGGNPQQVNEQEEAPNPSFNKMAQLLQGAKEFATATPNLSPVLEDISDSAQEYFSLLPEEVQDELLKSFNNPDELEIAIMNAYDQFVTDQQKMSEMQQGQQEMMEGEAEMEEAGMSPEDVAAMAEQQVLEMMYGGQLPKHQTEGYIDNFKPSMYNTPKGYQEPIYNKATFEPEPQYIQKSFGKPLIQEEEKIRKAEMMQKYQDQMQKAAMLTEEKIKKAEMLNRVNKTSEQFKKLLTKELGGQLPKAQYGKSQEYIDAYAAAAKALNSNLTNDQIMQQINEQNFAFKPQGKLTSDNVIADQMAADELIQSIPGLFNNTPDLSEKQKMQQIIQDEVLRQERIKEMEQSQGMTPEQRLQRTIRDSVFKNAIPKGQGGTNMNTLTDEQKKVLGSMSYSSSSPVKDAQGNVVATRYTYDNNKSFDVPKTQTATTQTNTQKTTQTVKEPMMTTPMTSKAKGGYPDYNQKLPSFELGDSGDRYKGKSNLKYPDYDPHNPNSISANLPRVVNQGRNKYTGTNVETGYYDSTSTTGQNGKEAPYNKYKPQFEKGGMIGKTIKYRKGGEVKTGKIIGISKTGKYIVK